MQINSRKKIINIDFEEEQNDQIEQQKPASSQILNSFRLNKEHQYGSHLIKRGMFSYDDDDDNYIVTYPEQTVKIQQNNSSNNHTLEKKPKQIENIRILVQVQHSNHQDNQNKEEDEPKSNQQTYNDNEQHSLNKPNLLSQQQNLQYIKPSKISKLLQVNFDQSSSEGSSHQQQNIFEQTQQQQQKRHQQIIDLLSLKPHERKNVTFEEIATTHDPIENMRVFCNKHIEMGKILLLNINRDKSGLNVFWPEYQLNFLQTGASMLWAKKMMGNTTSNYYITLKSGIDEVTHHLYFGKIRSNSQNSTYHVYTKGANPKSQVGRYNKRSIEATIVFLDLKGCYQPRAFNVYTLALQVKYQQLAGVKSNQEIGLDVLYNLQENKNKIFCFRTRKPIYSQAIQGYILNFSGRVQKASIKNFILQDSIAHRQVLMLGRLNDSMFRVDASWPLKPFVAFCICLANFDSKFVSS